jgi:hypothetical protein
MRKGFNSSSLRVVSILTQREGPNPPIALRRRIFPSSLCSLSNRREGISPSRYMWFNFRHNREGVSPLLVVPTCFFDASSDERGNPSRCVYDIAAHATRRVSLSYTQREGFPLLVSCTSFINLAGKGEPSSLCARSGKGLFSDTTYLILLVKLMSPFCLSLLGITFNHGLFPYCTYSCT